MRNVCIEKKNLLILQPVNHSDGYKIRQNSRFLEKRTIKINIKGD